MFTEGGFRADDAIAVYRRGVLIYRQLFSETSNRGRIAERRLFRGRIEFGKALQLMLECRTFIQCTNRFGQSK